MRVLVAMSGGVDSSVAAALLRAEGHDVVGATLKLWGGASDSGCCSVADVEDARRVAQQLSLPHHVFDYTDLFEQRVVTPYVAAHMAGETPNPCIECNRHVKFGSLLERVRRLGFDALATGHHARVERGPDGPRLRRGADPGKDQSYVLSMLGTDALGDLLLPIGELSKDEVRAEARRLGLRTAAKPDSQDVCFIHSTRGRAGFLVERMPLHPGTLVDGATGAVVGEVEALELVTVGQRRGLGLAVDGRRRFAVDVDVSARRVVVGDAAAARTTRLALRDWTWRASSPAAGAPVLVQASAHGVPRPATVHATHVEFGEPVPLVAPGQTVAFYDVTEPDIVLGAAVAAPAA
ncbi:MAG TPA: tRNA 2-thiouridine(34) synthase MnmA [Acidimicrobiales bacterium]|nr:tRNA 2-thiouridine(34) synthase MnmA [Acidimicrobiales bacterium]